MSSAPDGLVFRFAFWVIGTILFRYLGFYLGLSIVWIVSLGRYPTRPPSPAQRVTMFTIGVIALIAGLVAVRNVLWP